MVSNLRFGDIEKTEKTLAFIGNSEVDGINFSSISRNLGITKYKAELFVKLLTQAFILNPIYPKGTNVLKEPKVLMFLPFRLLYKDWNQCIGAIREDFFAEMLTMKGYKFHYLKTKRGAKTPDYIVEYGNERVVIEVGGKGKGREQFKGIKVEKSLFCPMFLKEVVIKSHYHYLDLSNSRHHHTIINYFTQPQETRALGRSSGTFA